MHELLWLLLPVAALSGWWLGVRRGRTDAPESETRSIDDRYIQGLNYLLHDERDKALEVFTRMVEIDNETAETHLALGALFSRRGEVDRAITIHENLIARSNLSRRQRAYALYALGEDYMKAGVFDRAESFFHEVIEQGVHTEPALERLLTVYEQEREWQQAIEIAERLERYARPGCQVRVAQLRCELAVEIMQRGGEIAEVRALLRQALKSDPNCARANILLGDLESQAGRYRAAIKAYKAVARQDPALLPETLDGLEGACRDYGRPGQFETFLRGVLRDYPDGRLMVRLAELVCERLGASAALTELATLLRRKPTVDGIRRLVSLAHSIGEPIKSSDLKILLELFDQLEAARPRYRCQQCGFSSRTLFWHCPSCKSWASIRPIGEVKLT